MSKEVAAEAKRDNDLEKGAKYKNNIQTKNYELSYSRSKLGFF
jgi:hypothetical protein